MSSTNHIGNAADTPTDNFLIDAVPSGTLHNVAGLLELLCNLDLEAGALGENAVSSLFRLFSQAAQAVRHVERELAGEEVAQ